MLSQDNLFDRLLRLDEDAYLLSVNDDRYICIIVGGGAMILMGYIIRMTHDIDVIYYTPRSLIELFDKYDFNANVSAHMTCFPENYEKRSKRIGLDTKKIDFYIISLEDLIISKLNANRDKDINDIEQECVINSINWDLLYELAEEVKLGLLNDRLVGEFIQRYNDYVRRFKK